VSLITIDSLPEQKITRDGIDIAYWVVGEGTPILLITGLGTPAASWYVLPSLLADQGYKVIVVDNRDCGKSSPCEGVDYGIADMAEDAMAVLDEVGIDQTYLFGISMGGMIAQELALNHPERVKKLILVATSPGRPASIPPDASVLSEMFAPVPSESVEEGLARFLGKLMGPGFAEQNWDLLLRTARARVRHGSNSESFSRQWQAILGFSAWDRLPKLDVPTLIIHGRADPLVPFGNGELLASRITGAELVALDGVGHFVPLEAPGETFGAIARFCPVEEKVETAG
jgi:3-oxoadipate enol-lactonase